MCFQNKSFPRFNHISRLKSLSYHTLNLAKPFCFYQSTLLLKFFLKILNNVQTNAFAQSMNVFVFNSLIYNLDLSTKYHIKTFYSKISSKKDVSYVYLFCCSQESIHWTRPILFFWVKKCLASSSISWYWPNTSSKYHSVE